MKRARRHTKLEDFLARMQFAADEFIWNFAQAIVECEAKLHGEPVPVRRMTKAEAARRQRNFLGLPSVPPLSGPLMHVWGSARGTSSVRRSFIVVLNSYDDPNGPRKHLYLVKPDHPVRPRPRRRT